MKNLSYKPLRSHLLTQVLHFKKGELIFPVAVILSNVRVPMMIIVVVIATVRTGVQALVCCVVLLGTVKEGLIKLDLTQYIS